MLNVNNAYRLKTIGLLKDHKDKVNSVSWSPDGKLIATTSDDARTIVWDTMSTSAQPYPIVATINLNSDSAAKTASWSTDGSTLAIGGDDGKLRLWSRATLKTASMARFRTGPVHALSWRPDGKTIASADHSGITLWNVAHRAVSSTLHGHRGAVQAVAFHPDGAALASAGLDEFVLVSDIRSDAIAARLDAPRSLSAGAAWRPDGGMLATLSTMGTVRLWLMPEGRLLAERRPATAATDKAMLGPAGLGFSPDGRLLVAPRGEGVWVMDVEMRRVVAVLRGHGGRVRAAAFSPDGTMVASASEDGTARVWGLGDREEVRSSLC